MLKERIAILSGLRTPMGKMGGGLAELPADILGSQIVREVYQRYLDSTDEPISEVIVGNVAQPAHAANVARVIALRAGIDESVPAFTVHRNCASGMEAITSGICQILSGQKEVILAAGVESMSNVPLLFRPEMSKFFEQMMRAKTIPQKLALFNKFKLRYLSPIIGLKLGLTDPVCNLIMGDTAENLAKDFAISREEQDKYANKSHAKAEKAMVSGIFAEEIMPIVTSGKKDYKMLDFDEGVRKGQTLQDLSKLKPFFDRVNGTVTAGNSSQITDGAAAVIFMSEKKAKKLGLKPLGFIKDFTYSGLEPSRMGLGPAYAISELIKNNQKSLADIDLFEINEAFAVQVIACCKALDSQKFCTEKLNLTKKLGAIPESKINVNGGAVALGHPVGMTGTRIIIHLLKEMQRRKKQTGIASLCIGGGQGAGVLLEGK